MMRKGLIEIIVIILGIASIIGLMLFSIFQLNNPESSEGEELSAALRVTRTTAGGTATRTTPVAGDLLLSWADSSYGPTAIIGGNGIDIATTTYQELSVALSTTGTTTVANLHVTGNAQIDNNLFAPVSFVVGGNTDWGGYDFLNVGEIKGTHFTATSTTATSTFAGGLTVDTSDFVVDPDGGRVGIGTASPGATLHVSGVARVSSTLEANSNIDHSSGQIWTVTGTLAAPSLAHRTDIDTGIYFPGTAPSGNIAIVTEGSERLRVDASGNVGIGTTSPYAKLSVVGEVVAPYYTATSTTATSTFAGDLAIGTGGSDPFFARGGANTLYLRPNSDSNNFSLVDASGNADGMRFNSTDRFQVGSIGSSRSLEFMQGGTRRWRVNTSGHFDAITDNANDIGASGGNRPRNIYAGTEVIVEGTTGTSTFAGAFSIGSTTPDGSALFSVGTSTQNLFVNKNSGNVGIASTTPWGLLSVNPNGISGPAFVVGSSTQTDFIVTNGGNVGIGTTTPSPYGERLTVQSVSGQTESSIFVTNDYVKNTKGSAYQIAFGAASGNTYADLGVFNDGGAVVGNMVLQSGGGNVGIGTTSPTSILSIHKDQSAKTEFILANQDIAGSAKIFLDTASGRNNDIITSGRLGLGSGGVEDVIYIDANQRVHISSGGSNAADRQLHVLSGTTDNAALFESSDANATINFQDNSSASNASVGVGAVGDKFRILTNSAEVVTIDVSGNVGIGNTSPVANLDVIGTMPNIRTGNNLTNSTTKESSWRIPHYTNAEEDVQLFYSFSTATQNQVVIGGGQSAANALTEIRFLTAANNTTVSGTERMRIDADGNIGIGTASPLSEFHLLTSTSTTNSVTYPIRIEQQSTGTVANDFGAGIDFYLENSVATAKNAGKLNFHWRNEPDDDTDFSVFLMSESAAPEEVLRLRSDERLYIGDVDGGVFSDLGDDDIIFTNALTDLSDGAVFGKVDFAHNDATEAGTAASIRAVSDGTAGAGALTFYTGFPSSDPALAERVRIDKDGDVGIASTSPWRTLGVTGTVGFDGLTSSATGNTLCLSTNKEVTTSGGNDCTVSSQRFKNNIKDIDVGLAELLKLNPKVFNYKYDNREALGLIAEEVEKIEPRLVSYEEDRVTLRSVRYNELTSLLIKAIQEQQEQIDELKGLGGIPPETKFVEVPVETIREIPAETPKMSWYFYLPFLSLLALIPRKK